MLYSDYSALQRIKQDAEQQWPGDYQKQIEAIRDRCNTYSSRRKQFQPETHPDPVERVRDAFLALDTLERDRFRQWFLQQTDA